MLQGIELAWLTIPNYDHGLIGRVDSIYCIQQDTDLVIGQVVRSEVLIATPAKTMTRAVNIS